MFFFFKYISVVVTDLFDVVPTVRRLLSNSQCSSLLLCEITGMECGENDVKCRQRALRTTGTRETTTHDAGFDRTDGLTVTRGFIDTVYYYCCCCCESAVLVTCAHTPAKKRACASCADSSVLTFTKISVPCSVFLQFQKNVKNSTLLLFVFNFCRRNPKIISNYICCKDYFMKTIISLKKKWFLP